MGRESAAERQRRRAVDEVRRGVARRDVARTVDYLLTLPREARADLVAPVADLVRNEIAREHRAGRWARLTFLAARIEREPRLLETGAGPPAVRDARWALLWAAINAREWDRARGHLEALELPPSPLARALAALVAARGAPEPAAIAGVPLPAAAVSEAAIGRSQVPVPPPPCTPEAVEARVLACYAGQAWSVFVATVEHWARAASPAVARPLLVLAAQLAARELWGAAYRGEAAVFIARAARDAGAPAELQAEVLLALRVAVAALPAEEPAAGPAARRYLAVAGAAASYAALRPVVVATLAGTLLDGDLFVPALAVSEELLRAAPSGALWLKAVTMWALGPGEGEPAPAWLVRALEALLGQPGELLAPLRGLPPDRQEAALQALAFALPLPLLERTLDLLWRGRDEPLGAVLGDVLDVLLARARAAAGGRRAERHDPRVRELLAEMAADMGLGGEIDLDEAMRSPMGRQLQAEAGALLDADESDELPVAVLPVWRRFRDRAVPIHVRFLELALVNAPTAAEAEAALAAHLAAAREIEAWLRVLEAAALEGCPRATAAVEARLLAVHGADPAALARGLRAAGRLGAPDRLRQALAVALIDAAAGAAPPLPAAVQEMLLEARMLDPRRPRRRGRRAGGTAPPPAPPRRRRSRRPPVQLDLLAEDPEEPR
ncbi:MAG TPA: DUF6109 family natural product biosynthesis protein [Polyangia bacterium]|jgi:hypothetical protein